MGGGDLSAGRRAAERLHRHPQIHRQPPADRNRHRHPGHRRAPCCCWACPAPPKPGCPSIWPPPSPAIPTALVQGTAGTEEDAIRYGWNYARLLAEGPSLAALVPSPIMRTMREGSIARVEELTRIPSDVQDSLITVLSEKTLPIPELDTEVQAQKGFNVIATANDRDRGVNELSSALKRRFNTVVLPTPETLEEEVGIVQQRVAALGRALELPAEPPALEEIRRLVTIFRELRAGVTLDGKAKLKSPSGSLSVAEAISVLNNGLALAAHFGDGRLQAADLAAGLVGAVVKDPVQDAIVWREYLETIVGAVDSVCSRLFNLSNT
ncbi:MAG: AAA family ATPase [Chromatiales bacterium]|nr:AAA family ATPase [Chromatiales bacterium]